jgi:hypothetical protein
MMNKITIERETLERLLSDYDSAAGNDGTLRSWNHAIGNILDLLRAALAAQSATPPMEQDAMGIAMVQAWDSHSSFNDAVHPLFQHGFEAGWKVGYKHGALAAQPAEVQLSDKPKVQALMDLARKFRATPGDLYDGAYKALESACYAAVAQPAPAAVPPDERIRVLREALELIHGQSSNDYAHDIFEARAIARATLEATK